MKRQRRKCAFTLLELVLVMGIVCTVLALAAPSLRGWSRGAVMNAVTAEFLAATRWARTQSVSECRVYRLQATEEGYLLAAQEGQEWVEPDSSLGRPRALPAGWRIQLTRLSDGSGAMIDFYPTGRCDPARVLFIADDGRSVEVRCDTPAEGFRVDLTPAARMGRTSWLDVSVFEKGPVRILGIQDYGRARVPTDQGPDRGPWRGNVTVNLKNLGLSGAGRIEILRVDERFRVYPVPFVRRRDVCRCRLSVDGFSEWVIGPAGRTREVFFYG